MNNRDLPFKPINPGQTKSQTLGYGNSHQVQMYDNQPNTQAMGQHYHPQIQEAC